MPVPELGSNLVDTFQAAARNGADNPFMWAKSGGSWGAWSWRRAAEEVEAVAAWLKAIGVGRGDRVLLVAENRPEWIIANLAIMTAAAVTVPAYITSTSEGYSYLLEHSDAVAVIASGAAGLMTRLRPAIAQSHAAKRILLMEAAPGEATTWAEAVSQHDALASASSGGTLGWDDTACFIYTSGTGGNPKGVVLSHRNIASNVKGVWGIVEQLELRERVFLSFLPLSHAYEFSVGQFLPIAMGAEIWFAEGVEALSSNLIEVRPSVMTCVPRLFEVLRHRILAGVDRQGPVKVRLFHLALALGRRRYEAGGRLPLHLKLLDHALETLVRKKVRERFGGRLKALVSGGAPLNYDVGLFFIGLGLNLLQGYGQTESSPTVSVNPPVRNKIDTVGPPLNGVELRIADDGEILVRGDLVMQGYWKDPEATAETLRDGWLHTGDVGVRDADGYLKITDRKKDIIVNSGGDNIAPQRVEGVLLTEAEIGQVLVYGDRRPHLVALVVPHAEFSKRWARQHGAVDDLASLAVDAGFRDAVNAAFARANGRLSTIERVRRFHLMSEPFTVENGTMTPTLKLRRHLIIRANQTVLESLYSR